MNSRIIKYPFLLAASSFLYLTSHRIFNEDKYQNLLKQTEKNIVQFHLNDRIIGQGAILKNGFIITNPDIFQQSQPQIQAFIGKSQVNYQIVQIDEGIAILKLLENSSKAYFNLAQNNTIGQEVYMLGKDEFGINEFQTCVIQDSNFTINSRLVPEDVLNVPYAFLMLHNCQSTPGSPVLNSKGELVGIQLNTNKQNKTQILPSTYFGGLENASQIQRPYLGCTLKTSEEGGAFIIKINSDSPAEKAGIRLGEVIKSIDGTPIIHGKDVLKLLGYVNKKNSYEMSISRDGKVRNVNVYMK